VLLHLNNEAMSGGALSDPSLVGLTFMEIKVQSSNQGTPMKKEALHFANQKCTPKRKGLKDL
jgi:hypothetical protein